MASPKLRLFTGFRPVGRGDVGKEVWKAWVPRCCLSPASGPKVCPRACQEACKAFDRCVRRMQKGV
eukprot:1115247-Prorocentrum_minimum.AAC.3